MRGDLSVVGTQASLRVRIAASATRFVPGEPLHNLGALTSGATSVNTFVLAAADTPVIGTHLFGGVSLQESNPFGTGTIVAHTSIVARPIGDNGVLRGKAETATNVDTTTELVGILLDVTLIDYSATGAVDGGELYTIKDTASADTSGLQIVNGDIFKGTLDVIVDPRAFRHDVS